MANFRSVYSQIKNLGLNDRLLYLVGVMLFFWAIFDGLLGYLVPLLVTQAGFTDTEMGIIFGSSSIFGAFFDFILSKYLNNTHFRRLYLGLFAICTIYPLVLWQAKGLWMFLLAMALWGVYFDLQNFGDFDFVGRKVNEDVHASHFGILLSFKGVGYLIAPLLAGLLIGTVVIGNKPFIFSWIILGISILFYISVLILSRKKEKDVIEQETIKPVNFIRELFLWKTIGRILIPVLILTAFLNIIDAFFWTIGPLTAESFKAFHPFNGLFLVAYELPPLIVGAFIGSIAEKYGKKRTAFISLMIGSLIFVYMPLFNNFMTIIGMIFLASCFIAMSWPSINGAYADYISESVKYEKEIEGIEDFSTNFGYIIGPILAGFFADKVGNINAFAYLGFAGVMVGLLLLQFTPKNIEVKVPQSSK